MLASGCARKSALGRRLRQVGRKPSCSGRQIRAYAELAPSDKVRVSEDVTVYHVPGNKDGLNLKGMEGTVDSDITVYKGVKLSPNNPWKIEFETEVKGKTKTFFVHMREDEVEKV